MMRQERTSSWIVVQTGIAACCISMMACSSGVRAEIPSVELKIEQVTFGPKHHLFGYIGQCLTIPWSEEGRYILSLEVGFHDRMPQPDDAAQVR